ncbi:MAG: ECF transporter S component [Synergistaceae bacterium]|nr:ECF transporter S component [Synergistaceae bacterium]
MMEAVSRCNNTRRMVWTALLSSVAAVLMYLDMAIPIFPAFLKMDLSDLPALIAAFAWGPAAGVLVELVKNLLHAFTTSTAGIGEAANFLIGSALVVPAGMIYRQFRIKKGALAGLVTGILIMALTAALANYFLLLPFYSRLIPLEKIIDLSSRILPAVHDKFTLVLYAIVPFNLLKGTLVSLMTLWLYKRISSLFCR